MLSKRIIAADGIILNETHDKIILIQRGSQTFKDYYALPGGTVEAEETVEEGFIREMKEELNLNLIPKAVLGVYSTPNRDPRGLVISISLSTILFHSQSIYGVIVSNL